MKRFTIAGSMTTLFCLGFATSSLAASPVVMDATSPTIERNAAVNKPAEKCLSDLGAFNKKIGDDGYWLGSSEFGYGYPMNGFREGFGPPMADSQPEATGIGYQNARPGYEVRMLVASATILARQGKQQLCENVLAQTRDIYKVYLADMNLTGARRADTPDWRQHQISAAQPVAAQKAAFRSAELLGTEVRNPKSEALGSVEDLVMSPQSGKIAYLVIARGGIFGIDEKYFPVPWNDFKISPDTNLLVLDTTKTTLGAAPKVKKDKFAAGQFDQESQKVDDYWTAHIGDKTTNGSKE